MGDSRGTHAGLAPILERLGWPLPPRTVEYCLYDTDGRLVWSSDCLSERAWMILAAVGIGFIGVVEICVFVFRKRAAA